MPGYDYQFRVPLLYVYLHTPATRLPFLPFPSLSPASPRFDNPDVDAMGTLVEFIRHTSLLVPQRLKRKHCKAPELLLMCTNEQFTRSPAVVTQSPPLPPPNPPLPPGRKPSSLRPPDWPHPDYPSPSSATPPADSAYSHNSAAHRAPDSSRRNSAVGAAPSSARRA